jgi:hypothetical protein
MSEMYMFKEKAVKDTTYHSTYGHAVGSFTYSRYDAEAVTKYASEHDPIKNQYEDYERTYDRSLATNAVYMFDDFSVSAALGFPPGIDATAGLGSGMFVTASTGITNESNLQGQVILQKKILGGNPFGLSVGGVLRRSVINVSKSGQMDFPESETYYMTNEVGIRSMFMLAQISGYDRARLFLYGTGSYNYNIDMGMTYPKVGIALGLY